MEKFLKIGEAAEILGLSERTLQKWVFERRIGFSKIGKKSVRIPMSEIDRLAKAGRVEPMTADVN